LGSQASSRSPLVTFRCPTPATPRTPVPHILVPVSCQLHLKLLSRALSLALSLSRACARSLSLSVSFQLLSKLFSLSLSLSLSLAFSQSLSLYLTFCRSLSLSLALLSSLSLNVRRRGPEGRVDFSRFPVFKKTGKMQKNKIYTHTWTLSHAHCRMTVTLFRSPSPFSPGPPP